MGGVVKAFGVLLVVVGVLAVAGAVALGVLPGVLDGDGQCGGFLLTLLSGGPSASNACLASYVTSAWLVPVAGLGGIVVLLVGVLFIQGSRMRELRSTLAYTRTSKGIGVSNASALSGNGVPSGAVPSGVTSSTQAEYAARVGYSRTPAAFPAATASAAPQFSAQPAMVQPTAQPAMVQPAMAQPAAGQPTMVQPTAQPAMVQPAAPFPPQQAAPQPAIPTTPPAGGFVQPGSGFAAPTTY